MLGPTSNTLSFVCKVWPVTDTQTLVPTNQQKVTTRVAKVRVFYLDKTTGYFDHRWAHTSTLESSTRRNSRMSSDSSSVFGTSVPACHNMEPL